MVKAQLLRLFSAGGNDEQACRSGVVRVWRV